MTDASTRPAPVTIALVRHGETDWNVQRRIQGRTDIPLNDTGRRQAVQVGADLADSSWDAVYASPLSRAVETAALIAGELGVPVQGHLDALSERSYGVLEGLDHAGRTAVEAQAATIEGLETRSAVIERAGAALTQIAAAHPGGRVVVVSHGGVIHSLILHLSGWTLPGAGYTVTNGSVHLVTATGDELELAEPELLTGTEG